MTRPLLLGAGCIRTVYIARIALSKRFMRANLWRGTSAIEKHLTIYMVSSYFIFIEFPEKVL